MAEDHRLAIPPKRFNTDYPVIDTDPFVCPVPLLSVGQLFLWSEDWAVGTGLAAVGPAFMLTTERYAPSFSGKGAFGPSFRLAVGIGIIAGVGLVYQRSCLRFYGYTENKREVDMDMKEMVGKVKKGEPLYGKSDMSPYLQGVAARNSRYSALLAHIIPWANLVNHNQHGVDTAKYYQQAERELEAEKSGRS